MVDDTHNTMRAGGVVRWGVAVLAVTAGWLVREGFGAAAGETPLAFIFFFPAVAFAAWYGRLGPALLALVLSALAVNWQFTGPYHTLTFDWVYGVAAMTGYVCSCGLIIGAIENLHRTKRQLMAQLMAQIERGKLDLAELEDDKAELEDDKEWVSTTLASIGDAVIATDPDGRVRFLNAEAERLTDWSSAEALGQPLSAVFRIMNEQTRQPVENPLTHALLNGGVGGLANHTVLLAKNGRETPIHDSAAPIRRPDGSPSGVIFVFRDFTEKRSAQETTARLAAIVEFSGDAILTMDLNGVIQSWNAGAERLFGYPTEEVVGKPLTILFPKDRLNEEQDNLRRLRSGQPVERFETIRVAKDGRYIPVAVSISPIRDVGGTIIGASKIVHDITDLKASREELLREKELLATILASIGDAVILTDPQGQVTFLNAVAERLTQWSSKEAAGRPLAEVFQIIHGEGGTVAEDPIDKVLRLGTAAALANDTVLISKDGSETPIDHSAAPIGRGDGPLFGVVLVFHDFPERRRQEQRQQKLYGLVQAVNQARDMSDIYQTALDTMAGCLSANRASILILDPDGVTRFKAWIGLSEEYRRAVEGHSPWKADQLDPEPVCITDVSEIEGELREVLQREGIHALSFIPITFKGKLLGKFMIDYQEPHRFTEDELRLSVTVAGQVGMAIQRQRTEEERENLVRERTSKLQEMIGELQHVSCSITHDIRAPLRAMGTFAGLIFAELSSHERASEELLDSCRRIITSAGRLDQLIQDALNYTKAVLQDRPLHPVDLARLVPGIIESYPNLQSDKADISIEDCLPVVLGEESLLTQCFSNLLGNAVKFVAPGVRPMVKINASEHNGTTRIIVSDNGIGISWESQRRLFGMFERLTSANEGTGIGLAIVRKVVERMGGKVGVESEPGKGSRFWIELRLTSLEAETCRQAISLLSPTPMRLLF
jgi:PAS domain S-box-containing protein